MGEPLHKRTHFRKIREVIIELAKYEGFNPNNYDLFKMTVYETIGENLKGKNVTYNIEGDASCWVKDNKYDMFEVPSLWNEKGSPYGEFLFLAYNRSFQYYLFGQMKTELNEYETKRSKYLSESVHFKNHGKFDIVFEKFDNHITKVEYGSKFDPGVQSSDHNFDFDSYNTRKMAYKTDRYKILKKIDPSFRGTSDPSKISGKDKVKVFNKNRKPGHKPGGQHNSNHNHKRGQGNKNFSKKRYH
jgi:hypothetical protein